MIKAVARLVKHLWHKYFGRETKFAELYRPDPFFQLPVSIYDEQRLYEGLRHCDNISFKRLRKFMKDSNLIEVSSPTELEIASNFLCAVTSDHKLFFLHSTPYIIGEGVDVATLERLAQRIVKYHIAMNSCKWKGHI